MTGTNKIIINIVGKQGELLKRFKEQDEFFDSVGLSQSNIYFKVRLYKFLCKFSVLKNLTLTCSYFKSNFKLIKKVCKRNADLFGKNFILVRIILSSLESFIRGKFYSQNISSSLENFIH